MKHFITVILVLLTISCKTTKEEAITYFGGQIINPKSDFVLFLKDNEVIDKLILDENNRFIIDYKDFEEGLYTFKHGNEFQYIYLQPTDSILVRLNTWDFDESLVFSGQGSGKNEYLINLFLQNEKEEKAMYQNFSLNEEDFQYELDLLVKERELLYDEFSENEIEISEGFKKLTNIGIHYPLYRLKEIYPYYYKIAHKAEKFPEISSDFYNFRKDINMNEADLVAFYPYQNYIVSYMYNLGFSLMENDSSKNNLTINILNFAEEKIELESFKNSIQQKVVVENFLNNASTCTIDENVLTVFLEYCKNDKLTNQVKNLVNDTEYVQGNQPLHNFEIVTYDNEKLDISNVIKNKNSVIYFWTTDHMASDYLVRRVHELENEYPNIEFIGINIQHASTSEDIANEPNLKKLDISNQFKLTPESFAHNYIKSNYPRTIIVNSEGIVINGFAMLNTKKLRSELKKLELN